MPLRGNWQPSAQTWGPLADMFRAQQEGSDAEPTVTSATGPDDAGVIRETVRMPEPSDDSATPAYLSYLPPPLPPVPGTMPAAPAAQEAPAEVPNRVEAMARLEMARRAATPPAPAPPSLTTQLVPEQAPRATAPARH